MEATVPSLQAGLQPVPRSHKGEATYAALDLGTNNCRLLIARPNGRHFRIVDAFSRIVRLGEGLAGSGSLSEEAMARAIDALKVCAHKIRAAPSPMSARVATEACRRAANCHAFLDRVRAETGLEIETISSAEEAVLAFKGCSPLLSVRRPRAVVFDIGGGSTELGWLRLRSGHPPQILDTLSIPFGVVNLDGALWRLPHRAGGLRRHGRPRSRPTCATSPRPTASTSASPPAPSRCSAPPAP